MRLAPAVLALACAGCAVHVETGTRGNCQEIVDALRALAERCGGTLADPDYCGGRVVAYATATQAAECRAWAESATCREAAEVARGERQRPAACVVHGF